MKTKAENIFMLHGYIRANQSANAKEVDACLLGMMQILATISICGVLDTGETITDLSNVYSFDNFESFLYRCEFSDGSAIIIRKNPEGRTTPEYISVEGDKWKTTNFIRYLDANFPF